MVKGLKINVTKSYVFKFELIYKIEQHGKYKF